MTSTSVSNHLSYKRKHVIDSKYIYVLLASIVDILLQSKPAYVLPRDKIKKKHFMNHSDEKSDYKMRTLVIIFIF